MNRKNFIKKSILTSLAAITTVTISSKNRGKPINFLERVGFNHLPNKEMKTMRTVLHRANTRNHEDFGWLEVNHTFSFANYYNPERMSFGVLRVLNDDKIKPLKGFGMHPHKNMEIISIPLEGALKHKDNLGNEAVINYGDVQVMSAGTGIVHSEFNNNANQDVKLLQIWLFPNKQNVTPRYDQITLTNNHIKNKLYQILSPNKEDEGVWIHQNAWFHLGEFDKTQELKYSLKDKLNNGVYIFVLKGNVTIENQKLNKRDGFGLWSINNINIEVSDYAKIVLMEVPMKIK